MIEIIIGIGLFGVGLGVGAVLKRQYIKNKQLAKLPSPYRSASLPIINSHNEAVYCFDCRFKLRADLGGIVCAARPGKAGFAWCSEINTNNDCKHYKKKKWYQ